MSLCVVTDPAHTEAISVTVTMTVLTAVTSMIVNSRTVKSAATMNSSAMADA